MSVKVRSLAVTYYSGHHVEPHAHPWGQFVYASQGVMRVGVNNKFWIVPPERAVWAPPKSRHEILTRTPCSLRTLYLTPALAAQLPNECDAVEVSPLLRELVVHIVRVGMLDSTNDEHERLIGVLLDQLRNIDSLPLLLRMPADRRALAIALRLQNDPADAAELIELARFVGASTRTLQRLFRTETGLSFVEWRQRLRMLHAVTLLNSGSSVTAVGYEAGYASTSAFIAAFRKQFGDTPLRYKAANQGDTTGSS